MAIDLSKLSPAPWRVGPPPALEVLDANQMPVNQQGFRADMEFEALARNAFEVQMSRGWMSMHIGCGKWYAAEHVPDGVPRLVGPHRDPICADDPFTALVEADKWYRENVEGKTDG